MYSNGACALTELEIDHLSRFISTTSVVSYRVLFGIRCALHVPLALPPYYSPNNIVDVSFEVRLKIVLLHVPVCSTTILFSKRYCGCNYINTIEDARVLTELDIAPCYFPSDVVHVCIEISSCYPCAPPPCYFPSDIVHVSIEIPSKMLSYFVLLLALVCSTMLFSKQYCPRICRNTIEDARVLIVAPELDIDRLNRFLSSVSSYAACETIYTQLIASSHRPNQQVPYVVMSIESTPVTQSKKFS